jgi:uncharacterized C2H2 Zn-finger protein
MTNALFMCTTCNDIFRNRHDLNNHVRHEHQSSVKVKFQNGGVTEVKKAEDDTFKCKCGKSFKLPHSLRRHAKNCTDELSETEHAYETEMEISEGISDASESSEFIEPEIDDTPIDCYGALFSREIG